MAWLLVSASADGQSISDKTLLGYWHNWLPEYRLTEVPDEYNIIAIAFSTAQDRRGYMTFNPSYDAALFKQDVAAVQQQGRKVIISIGGGGDVLLKLETDQDKQNFVTTMKAIIDEYNFDGLDIDLEGHSIAYLGDVNFKNPTTITSVNFLDAVDELLSFYDDDFLLTAAPEVYYVQAGFKGVIAESWDPEGKLKGSFFTFLHRFHDRIDYLAVQLYNIPAELMLDNKIYDYGTVDAVVAATHMLLHGIPVGGYNKTDFSDLEWIEPFKPEQILVGLPASASAAGSGQLTDDELNKALDALILGETSDLTYQLAPTSGYPKLGGLMTWSINWDKDERSFGFANNFKSYLQKLSTLTVKHENALDFGDIDAYKSATKVVTFNNYTSADETVSIENLPAGIEVSEEEFVIPANGSKQIEITIVSDQLGSYQSAVSCVYEHFESSEIILSAEVNCFKVRGTKENFNSSELPSNWNSTDQMVLSQDNDRMKVTVNKTGGLWDSFEYTFDEIDLSRNLDVMIDLESDEDFTLRIDLVDADWNYANYYPATAEYKGGSGVKTIRLNFEGKLISWPDKIPVDPTRINRVYIHTNPGATFQGVVYIDNFILGNPEVLKFENELTVCGDEPYSFGTQSITQSGTYLETFQSSLGCDSLVALNLTVLPKNEVSILQEICDGETHQFGNQVLTSSGEYSEVFEAMNGCDSLVNLTLTVNPTYDEHLEAEICNGDSFEFEGSLLTEKGEYTHVYQLESGCDSTVTISLEVLPRFEEQVDVSICNGSDLEFGGQILDSEGEYSHVFQSAAGCDSTVVLNLTLDDNPLEPVVVGTAEMISSSISGDSYEWYNCENMEEPISGVNNMEFYPTASGSYAVKVFKDGCMALSDCFEFEYILGSRLDNIDFEIFPNPTTSRLYVKLSTEFRKGAYQLYGLNGVLVLEGSIDNQKEIILDIHEPAGVYVLRLHDFETDQIHQLKVTKQ